jgi:hypothetical protein
MKASYRVAKAEAEGLELRLMLEVENRSDCTWKGGDGFAIGSQLIDAERNLYVEDGPRARLEADVAPGGVARVALNLQIPACPGDHRIYLSPWLGEQGWAYAQGWPFLILDVRLEDGRLRPTASRVVTLRRLKAELLAGALARALIAPVQTLWRNRGRLHGAA